eukprot:12936358-Alexandrium_andersonii.AAC.1
MCLLRRRRFLGWARGDGSPPREERRRLPEWLETACGSLNAGWRAAPRERRKLSEAARNCLQRPSIENA